MMLPSPFFLRCVVVVCLSSLFAAGDQHAGAQTGRSHETNGEVKVREVMPTGWRRTVNGWENTSHWQRHSQAQQLQHWIHVSRQHESPRVIAAMAELQQLHPLLHATCLLAFTSAVFWISSLRRQASAARRHASQSDQSAGAQAPSAQVV